MSFSLTYTKRREWPPLAWVACVPNGGGPVAVTHGPAVEARSDWFGDVVWDGALADGDFDESDIVFGSGARLRDDEIVFASSVAMIDRLQWFRDSDAVWVSNSLVALLAAIEGEVDPLYRHYPRDFESVIRGMDEYVRGIQTNRGPVRLTYFRNLRVGVHGETREEMKPRHEHELDRYEGYRGFLERALQRLAGNAADQSRSAPLSLLGTVSSGFDSPTAAALARSAGLTEAFTITTARGGHADSGEEIGRRLGLEMHLVTRDAWRGQPFAEVPFLASDAKGEDVYFAGAGDLLRHRLVVTGFGATNVWSRSAGLNLEMRRGDQSGLSLTEYRLHAGFVHLPVPAIGAIYQDRIRAMLQRSEMNEWSRSGGKPFARRVLVEEGIPEHLFGHRFKAASVLFFDRHSFLTPASRADFETFLAQARRDDRQAAWRQAVADLPRRAAGGAVRGGRMAASLIHRAVPRPSLERIVASERVGHMADLAPTYRYLFPWAADRLRRTYAGASGSGGSR